MTEKFAVVVITEALSSGGLMREHVSFRTYEVDLEIIEDQYQQDCEALQKYPFYKAVYLAKIMEEEEKRK